MYPFPWFPFLSEPGQLREGGVARCIRRQEIRTPEICTANYASVKGGAGQGQPSPAQPSLARPRLPAIGAAAVAPTPLRSPGAAPTATRPAPAPKGKAVPAAPRLGSGATAAYLRFEGVVNDGRHSATV